MKFKSENYSERIKETIENYFNYTFDTTYDLLKKNWLCDYILEITDEFGSKMSLMCLEPGKIDVFIGSDYLETLKAFNGVWVTC